MAVDLHPPDAVRSWLLPARTPILLKRPAEVMGIINVTPDSFSDGGAHRDQEAAAEAGARMRAHGAAWIDVGGESTRPGAEAVPSELEIRRVIPAIRALLAQDGAARVSVDTSKPEVAREALAAGALMVNDVTAARDPRMLEVVAEAACPLVLMHMQGAPSTMQRTPHYRDVVGEVEEFFRERLRAAEAAGVPASRIVLDPGIGFGKTVAHNLALLRSLPRLERAFDRPLVVGVSRKSFIARLVGAPASDPPASRDGASHVLHGLLARSCALLRVHDVPGAVAACRLAQAVAGEWHPHA
jgi:dihydropteroate synthase